MNQIEYLNQCPQCGRGFFLGVRTKDGTHLCDTNCRVGWTRRNLGPVAALPPERARKPPRPPVSMEDAPRVPGAKAWSPFPELAFYIPAEKTG